MKDHWLQSINFPTQAARFGCKVFVNSCLHFSQSIEVTLNNDAVFWTLLRALAGCDEFLVSFSDCMSKPLILLRVMESLKSIPAVSV